MVASWVEVGVPTLVFVCAHGALKSRVSAAFFNAAAPAGWVALSASVEPQEVVSVHAARLVDGTAAQAWLEMGPPQPLSSLSNVDRVIAVDCDVPGAER